MATALSLLDAWGKLGDTSQLEVFGPDHHSVRGWPHLRAGTPSAGRRRLALGDAGELLELAAKAALVGAAGEDPR